MSLSISQPTREREGTLFAAAVDELRPRIDRALAAWIVKRRVALSASAPEAAILADEVARLVAGGGKRLRPALLLVAYRACGGRREGAALRLAMAVELLHTYLLVHDDIMDHAATRRGVPTTHAAFAERQGRRSSGPAAAELGRAVAILVGDLVHTWAVELARPEPAIEGDPARVAAAFDAMCEEVIAGQFLEMSLPHRETVADEDLVRVLRLKSGRYSVERPVELGALLAGADDATLAALRAYGEAAGEAFQLQDDVLGTFGDADTVGKSVVSDLAEGKRTFLIHHALAGAAPEDAAWLRAALGRADLGVADAERARGILRTSGALAAVEEMIDERLARSRRALDGAPAGLGDRDLLAGFLDYLRERDR